MRCPKCEGRGVVDNARYYSHGSAWAYEHGVLPTRPCKHCNRSGYIIGNIAEIAERLRSAINGVTITPDEAKQMYESIMK